MKKYLFVLLIILFTINSARASNGRNKTISDLMFPLDSFTLNLADAGGKRYLKLTMALELGNKNVKDEVEANLAKIKDSVIILLSGKTFEDIYSIDAKFKLRDEMARRINRFLIKGHIRNIYFTEFVVF